MRYSKGNLALVLAALAATSTEEEAIDEQSPSKREQREAKVVLGDHANLGPPSRQGRRAREREALKDRNRWAGNVYGDIE